MAARKPTHHAATGRFMRTADQIARDRQAADLRSLGYTFPMIAERMGTAVSTAFEMVNRAISEIPTEGTAEAKRMELDKLDRLERYYQTVMGREHYKVGNNGKIVHDDVGRPVMDDAPRMTAAAGLLRIQERRARLMGLDAPTRSRLEVITEDAVDAEIRRLEAEVGALAKSDDRRPGRETKAAR